MLVLKVLSIFFLIIGYFNFYEMIIWLIYEIDNGKNSKCILIKICYNFIFNFSVVVIFLLLYYYEI